MISFILKDVFVYKTNIIIKNKTETESAQLIYLMKLDIIWNKKFTKFHILYHLQFTYYIYI